MKHTTTIALAVRVMAATGCETAQEKEARGLVRTQGGEWVPKGTSFFGSGHMGPPPAGFAFDPTVFNEAMAAHHPPPPAIVVGSGSGTTMASQVGGTTVVSQFGGYRPIYTPPVIPINTGNNTPTVYTMPIQQP